MDRTTELEIVVLSMLNVMDLKIVVAVNVVVIMLLDHALLL